ncbi:RNA polymerase recycling motor ATPase HelR [Knoellia subterranea]|uniref:ATPase AAA n=1 Tax=Knoellia subterranea KCTC 19937 TaxID=1385521 RepID=A0A0A0JSP8_9MICO|nr:RNA polymerase recycling motor ATPase HelR [Knoellia subterranea]KGN38651.1 ATPase AAA [Knoellia subterranea KCTC 19937]
MTTTTTPFFTLPPRLSPKADPLLIARDDAHFATIADTLDATIAELSERLRQTRLEPGGAGRAALDRDLEVHRLTARLRALGRYGVDLCLGRIDPLGEDEPIYVGRLGLSDAEGTPILVDWRSPAAEPFFGATHADPMGLASRRRYRWQAGRVVDYWDEVFTADGLTSSAALDDQSAFIASLGTTRSERMRDVLGTIQADQDAIVRAGSKGALVVDGGPGTGKTVVALHRTAYLLYSDPRLGHRKGGVLFVGPHEPYLAYVSDVLPSLGEEGVLTCTVRDLVPEGAQAPIEADESVARLKASAVMVSAIEPAVALYEEPPTDAMIVETPWADVALSADDWSVAFDAPAPGTPHNEAREEIWEELVTIALDRLEDEDVDASRELLTRVLRQDEELVDTFHRAWPLLEATDVVGDLWTVPAYLKRCAPWLSRDEVFALQREDPQAWTVSDLPILDAARQRLGDPTTSRRRQREADTDAVEREQMAQVIDNLIAADDDGEGLVTMLRHPDLRENFVEDRTGPSNRAELLAGRFAHIVVDEAQELTDAEWQMLLLRCPSRSFTIVGDRAQARRGFTETWEERLGRIGLDHARIASLTVNYRTPAEVMDYAAPHIRAVLPDANVPRSIRSTGVPVEHGRIDDLESTLARWSEEHAEGVACVIGAPWFEATERVQSLTPELAKGLEFDLVVLVDPDRMGGGIEGAVDRYVAMTRATQRLVVLSST